MTTAHARRTDPETSHLAAASVDLTLGQLTVLGAFEAHRSADGTPMGLTDEDVYAYIGEILSPSGARSRRAELVRAGRIVDTGARRRLASGRLSTVWGVATWAWHGGLPVTRVTPKVAQPPAIVSPLRRHWVCQVCLTSSDVEPPDGTLLEGVRLGRCGLCRKRTTWRRE